MNLHLAYFGDNSFSFGKERLKQQANSFSIFKSIQEFGENDLTCDFWVNHASKMMERRLSQPSKFYGYYACKPHFALKALKNIPENDILLLVDAGCELNKNGKDKLFEYYEETIKNNGLFFHIDHPEIKWTKMDTYRRIMGDDDKHFMTSQIISTAYLLKNNQFIRDFVDTWKNICIEDAGKYLDDSPSILKNHDTFVENRHDQSILSLLVKKYSEEYDFSFYSDDTYENIWLLNNIPFCYEFEGQSKIWNTYGKEFPIWATRSGRQQFGFCEE